MNKEEISAENHRIWRDIQKHEMEIKKLKIELEHLETLCEHEDAFRRSVMGKEYEMYCPTCGMQS